LSGSGEARLESGDVLTDRRANIRLRDRTAFSTTGDGDGTIRIRAGRFLLTEESSLSANNNGSSDSSGGVDIEAGSVEMADGASISASTSGGGDAGTVKVEADQMIVDGSGISTRIRSDVSQAATGHGGVVTINVTDLKIRDGGEIRASTFGAGMAGSVVVEAPRLLISGEGLQDLQTLTGISSSAEPTSTRDGGRVRVTADELELRDRGVIRSVTFSRGDAGRVTVEANRASLLGGGQISSSTFGTGKGGDVVVTVRDALSISGQSRFQTSNRVFPPSGVFASTNSRAADAGRAGNATVTAPVITITDHGEISSESRFSGGHGGVVSVTAADRLVVDAGEISTEATGAGAAGAIRVIAEALELRNGGSIHSNAEGAGGAGAVTVEASGRLFLFEGSEVSTDSAAAGGGEIRLRVGDAIVLRDSNVTTSVQGGTEPTAGSIFVDPKVLVIDGGMIKAEANAPSGFGGQVRIVADNILVPGGDFQALVDQGDISASGGTPERAGIVAVNAPEVDLSGGLVVLEGALLDAASQLRERCGARRDIGASSFTGVGRGGLPPGPDGPLAGAYLGRDAAGGARPEQAAVAPPERARPPSRPWAVAAVAPCVAWPETATGWR
jgi:large exoprotein involved in heme utilization and adhesion